MDATSMGILASGWLAFLTLAAWALWRKRVSPGDVLGTLEQTWQALPAEQRTALEGRVKGWLESD